MSYKSRSIENDEYVVLLDIGTCDTKCAIASRDGDRFTISGLARGLTQGISISEEVEKPIVTPSELGDCIRGVVNEAKGQLTLAEDVTFPLYVGISDLFIECEDLYGARSLTTWPELEEKEVKEKDVLAMLSEAIVVRDHVGKHILHLFPYEYMFDTKRLEKEPIGTKGIRMNVSFVSLFMDAKFYQDIVASVQYAGHKVGQCFSSSIASAWAISSKEEREAGAIVIDIGYQKVEAVFFHKSRCWDVRRMELPGFKSVLERVSAETGKTEQELLSSLSPRQYGQGDAAGAESRRMGTLTSPQVEVSVWEKAFWAWEKNCATELLGYIQRVRDKCFRFDKVSTIPTIILTGGPLNSIRLDLIQTELNKLLKNYYSASEVPVYEGKPSDEPGCIRDYLQPENASLFGLLDLALGELVDDRVDWQRVSEGKSSFVQRVRDRLWG